MKRSLVTVVVLLVLAVMVTAGVTAGCFLFAKQRGTRQMTPIEVADGPRLPHDVSDFAPFSGHIDQGFGWTSRGYFGPQPGSDRHVLYVYEMEIGYPMPCAATTSMPFHWLAYQRGREISVADRANEMPSRMLWAGVAGNTVVYFFVLLTLEMLRRGPRRLRRWMRIRGGRCPHCGYPASTSAICTECGRPRPPLP